MDASRVGDVEAGDHTGRGAQAVGQSYASLADGVGESLVAGDHRNDVAATGQKQELWLRYEGGAEGSSDVGSNIADGGGRGVLGREDRAEVPFNRLENKRFPVVQTAQGPLKRPASLETRLHQGVPIVFFVSFAPQRAE